MTITFRKTDYIGGALVVILLASWLSYRRTVAFDRFESSHKVIRFSAGHPRAGEIIIAHPLVDDRG